MTTEVVLDTAAAVRRSRDRCCCGHRSCAAMQQRLPRGVAGDLDEVRDGREATARSRGLVLCEFWPELNVLRSSGLIAEDVDGAFTVGYDGALGYSRVPIPLRGAVSLRLRPREVTFTPKIV